MGYRDERGRLYCLVPLFEISCSFDLAIVHWAVAYGTSCTCTRPGEFLIHELRCWGKQFSLWFPIIPAQCSWLI